MNRKISNQDKNFKVLLVYPNIQQCAMMPLSIGLFTSLLKNNGFYFAEVKLTKIKNTNKTVNLIYNVELGERAKIKKIKFIGDKKYKNRKLFRIIASEENKFWKFLTKNKFLDIKCFEMIIMPNHFHCIIKNVGADLCVCPDKSLRDLRILGDQRILCEHAG